MNKFGRSLKRVVNKRSAYNLLDHLKDFKIVYAAVVFAVPILGVTIDPESASRAIVNGADMLASFLHSVLG